MGETDYAGTLRDVDAAIDHLASLAEDGLDLDLTRVVAGGHSAGGQLALWAAARGRSGLPGVRGRVRLSAVAGLAPACDLIAGHAEQVGRGVVAQFLGGSPDEVPERYAAASPRERLPLGVGQLVLHGTEDDTLPVAMSRAYAAAAGAAGDEVELQALSGVGHMEFIDPSTSAYEAFRDWLERAVA